MCRGDGPFAEAWRLQKSAFGDAEDAPAKTADAGMEAGDVITRDPLGNNGDTQCCQADFIVTGEHQNPNRAERQLFQQARGQFFRTLGEEGHPGHARVGTGQQF